MEACDFAWTLSTTFRPEWEILCAIAYFTLLGAMILYFVAAGLTDPEALYRRTVDVLAHSSAESLDETEVKAINERISGVKTPRINRSERYISLFSAKI